MCWVYIIIVLNLANSITGQKPKTIIVGAGAAGIAAASKLYANDFRDIKVLEAKNRIRGRIFTTGFDRSLIDLRAQWVVGETKNIVFALAEPLERLKIPDQSPGLAVINSKGCPVSTEVVMFAEEATSSHHFSTVHGAIESGFGEANRLIDLYNKRKKVSKRSMKIFKNVNVI